MLSVSVVVVVRAKARAVVKVETPPTVPESGGVLSTIAVVRAVVRVTVVVDAVMLALVRVT
jgi:hypothetical protein